MSAILRLDRRIVWFIILICIFYPLIYPLGLPIHIEAVTKEYYQTVEDLAPGSVVVTTFDIEAGLWGEQGPQAITTLKHIFDKEGVRFIQVSFYRADCAVLFETMVLSEVDRTKKEYGVEWINMGYLEGKETAMAAFASNFMYPAKDAYGTPLEELPLLQEVKSMADVDLYVTVQGSGYMETCLRQFSLPFDKPAIAGCMGMGVPDMMVYRDAGIVGGLLPGLSGAAQYEYLLKKPGLALRGLDSLSLAHIFLIALAIVVNIVYIATRSSGGRA